MTPEQLAIKNVGKQDPKRHLEEKVDVLMSTNIVQCLGAMVDTAVFKWSSLPLFFYYKKNIYPLLIVHDEQKKN